MGAWTRAAVRDTPPPLARPIISQVLYTLGSVAAARLGTDRPVDSVRKMESTMWAVTLAKNLVLSLLGLAFIWFFAVSIPFHIADWDSALFPIGMGAIRLIGWIPIILGGCVIVWCYCLFVLIGRGTP
jgi:hypothetical protein